jgi:hypothetical protein
VHFLKKDNYPLTALQAHQEGRHRLRQRAVEPG